MLIRGCWISLIFLLFALQTVSAQQPVEYAAPGDTTDPFTIGFRVQHGYLFAHSVYVKSAKGAEPTMYELDLSWLRYNDDVWRDANFYPRFGMVFSLTALKRPYLGHSYTFGLYIQPYLMKFRTLTPYLRGGCGISWMTTPHHSYTNDINRSYSTHLNFYLFMSLGLNYQIDPKLGVTLGAYFNHMSNAGYKEYNGGINFPGLGLGVEYTFNPVERKPRKVLAPYDYGERKTRHDIAAYLGYSAISWPDSGQFQIYGFSYRYSHQVNRFGAIAAGVEFEINERALHKVLRQWYPPGLDHRRVSLFAGYEFLMGHTIFSIVVGGYIYRPVKESSDIYQEYQLVYELFDNFYTGFNFKADAHVADFLNWRFIYSL